MSKPLLLDLFCGAGGASMGYHRAGFDVIGIDIRPMPRYPFPFFQADAMEVLDELELNGCWEAPPSQRTYRRCLDVEDFAAIHASPPCQHYTLSLNMFGARQDEVRDSHPDLLAPTRDALNKVGLPYVIENVVRAPMRADIKLCGCQFPELWRLKRERWFELSWGPIEWVKPKCNHPEISICVIGGNSPSYNRARLGFSPTLADWQRCMGIDWMRRKEMSESIPPAYSEYVGGHLMRHLNSAAITSALDVPAELAAA